MHGASLKAPAGTDRLADLQQMVQAAQHDRIHAEGDGAPWLRCAQSLPG